MIDERRLVGPEALTRDHDTADFDCGIDSLNDYLKSQALPDQAAGKSRSYVILSDERVVGYFSLAAASIESEDATARAGKGQGRQAIPGILLGRLGLDVGLHDKGLGESLLMEALRKSLAAAETIGARVVLAHALDARARAFYLKYGFEPSPCHELLVMILMKDVRKNLLPE